MKKIIFLFFILPLLCCVSRKERPAGGQRIISLAPSITEMIYALKLEDKLVAVSDYCTYPEQVKDKEKVGGLLNPNLEKITSLNPTLILATYSNQQLVTKITNPNIKVVLLPEKTVQDVYFSIDSIAALNGVQNRAKTLISSIRDSLKKYVFREMADKPRALLVVGRDRGSTNNIGLSGPGAFLNELWVRVGGSNAFPDMPASFTQVTREDVLSRNPNIIIEFKTVGSWDDTMTESNKNEWQNLRIDAVKSGNIFVINGVDYLVPGPRIYLLAKEYYNILSMYHGFKTSG